MHEQTRKFRARSGWTQIPEGVVVKGWENGPDRGIERLMRQSPNIPRNEGKLSAQHQDWKPDRSKPVSGFSGLGFTQRGNEVDRWDDQTT